MTGQRSKEVPATLSAIAEHLDDLLDVRGTPDYPGALNGIQFAHVGPVRGVAAAVDFSRRAIEGAIAVDANLLIVHHGMFWGGAQPVIGPAFERIRMLLDNDIAVYSSHLPLDRHATFGNNPLLAKAFALEASGGFARFETIEVGVRGTCDVRTNDIVERASAFALEHGGRAIATAFDAERRTRRWGICTGAGASSATLSEAMFLGIDTLIVGEGPHHTAVQAEEMGIVIVYCGHYATETLGVRALAQHVGEEFGVPWTFVATPTGT